MQTLVNASETSILPSTHNDAISDYTITTRYARYDHKKKRRETWKEMIERVRDMHKFRYGAKGINKEIDWAFEQVLDKRVLPSMRSLQFGGDAIIANDARIYNCSFTLADRQRFFSEALWLLLSGVGVGFSVQKQHVAKLPKLVKHADASEKEVSTYVVGDTIEGWADAIEILMNSYFVGNPLSGKEVFFDYSRIRRKGSWLKTSGGRAPGPKPLMRAVKQIKKLLHDVAESGCDQLKPINVYDIAMIAADCVLAGGIRRSATICLFSLDDEEMMQAKTMMKRSRVLSNKSKDGTWLTDLGEAINLKNDKGNDPEAGEDVNIGWFNICPWRARSNNSVALLRNKCKFEDFEKIVNSAKAYGEPGFVFLDNLDYGYNPCCEIGLNPIDPKTGSTGWGFCNLCEINGGKIKSIEDYKTAVKSATIIGTMQAGFTYLHYLTDTTRNIVRREALLGISITGWMDNPDILLNAENQREMAKYAVEVNREFSEKIGIPSAARVTCTKPSGSTSLVLGTSSGIHPHHSRRYFRRIVANSVEQPLRYFALHNPKMIEKSVWGTNDEVITFCIEVPPTAILKNDLTAIQFLDNVKKTYENWVYYGTARPDSSPGLTHNVSNTVLVDEHEWEKVTKYIFENRHCFSGISLLPKSGDKIYKQAPFEKVETEADIKKWNELVREYQPVDWSLFEENEDYTSLKDVIACAGGSCER
jgi:ribonucleoside-diphosphate reductase alpha chain